MLVPVILSGGSGTRLWPLSRELHPKQMLSLTGKWTMLQETLMRLTGIPDRTRPLLVCNEKHRFLVAEQLRRINVTPASILLEPHGRNTAPAVALAALAVIDMLPAGGGSDDPLLLVLPADHVIRDLAALEAAVAIGVEQARAGRLVTFGIVPTHAETGYGYIRRGPAVAGGESCFAVDAFAEKPDHETAVGYLDSGTYYWNSGMFLFRAARYLEELAQFAPDIAEACQRAVAGAGQDMDFLRVDAEAFAQCPSDSVDYAVMERTSDAVVVPLDAGWNDVGSWSALHAVCEKDAAGNVQIGDVLAVNTRNSYLSARSRLLATVGVEDHVVVETRDAVLVAHKDQVQDIKKLVDELNRQGRDEPVRHREDYRPWGSYDTLDGGTHHRIRRITVNPGASLAMQLHHHRAEHWIVVQGTARVVRGDETLLLGENQSTFIPAGVRHRLENPGKVPLQVVEVQSGSYVGEDDVVRFGDARASGNASGTADNEPSR